MRQATLNQFVWCHNLVADCPVILEAFLVLAVIWFGIFVCIVFESVFIRNALKGGGDPHPWLRPDWSEKP